MRLDGLLQIALVAAGVSGAACFALAPPPSPLGPAGPEATHRARLGVRGPRVLGGPAASVRTHRRCPAARLLAAPALHLALRAPY